jgi:hypothetical protein
VAGPDDDRGGRASAERGGTITETASSCLHHSHPVQQVIVGAETVATPPYITRDAFAFSVVTRCHGLVLIDIRIDQYDSY